MRKYHPLGPQDRIPVHGPRGTGTRVAQAYGLPLDPGMTEEFDFQRIREEPLTIGPLTVTARRVEHPIEAYGIRVEHNGRSLVYSGDTALCRSLCELAADADLLLAEAAFRDGVDNPPGIHMTGSEAAAVARDARVGRLVLTHIPPWHAKEEAVAEARGVYDGPVLLAHEGATYDL
jgi:ribonuclease BN (tRNA processing enzyme)